MMIFHPDTPNLDRKLQEIEDGDLRNFLKEKGYSDEKIEIAVRNNHLQDAITRLEDILCEPDEIIESLLKDGWKSEEIEEAFKHRNSKRS